MEIKNARKKNDTMYIYGLDSEYRIVHYFFILKEKLSAQSIASTARYLKENYPSVEQVYCVDNSREIFKAFMDLRENENKLENTVHFKMMLEQYGFRAAV